MGLTLPAYASSVLFAGIFKKLEDKMEENQEESLQEQDERK